MSKKRKKQNDRRDLPVQEPAKPRKVLYWVIALAVSLALNAALAYNFYTRNYSQSELNTMLSDCMVRLEDCQANSAEMETELSRVRTIIDDKSFAIQRPTGENLSDDELEWLRKQGLNNPVANLRNDLLQHAELIPFKTGSGLKLKFPTQEAIYILSKHFALAKFTDGIQNGHMVVEFKVDNGKINWEVLKAYQD